MSIGGIRVPVHKLPSYRTLTTYTHQALHEIPEREFNSLLVSHLRIGGSYSTWNLFRQMHHAGRHLSAYTFTPVLGSCSENSRQGPQVHSLMMKLGLDSGPIIKTALIHMYSRYYAQLDNSVLVFEEIEEKDVVSWNAMISSFLRHGLPVIALCVFEAAFLDLIVIV